MYIYIEEILAIEGSYYSCVNICLYFWSAKKKKNDFVVAIYYYSTPQ